MKSYKSAKDKTESRFFLTILLTGVLFSGFGIWTIVEFILYLVKDNPFNWWSLGLTIGVFVLNIFFSIMSWKNIK